MKFDTVHMNFSTECMSYSRHASFYDTIPLKNECADPKLLLRRENSFQIRPSGTSTILRLVGDPLSGAYLRGLLSDKAGALVWHERDTCRFQVGVIP